MQHAHRNMSAVHVDEARVRTGLVGAERGERVRHRQQAGLTHAGGHHVHVGLGHAAIEEAAACTGLVIVEQPIANVAGEQIYVGDASPVVQINDANLNGIVDGTDTVWLYFGLRRGGRAYYALDITNVDAPRFMWKITPTFFPSAVRRALKRRLLGRRSLLPQLCTLCLVTG